MATVSGRLSAAAAVVRHSPRKSSSTITASAPPISIASRTLCIESRTSAAWSYTGSSRTPGRQQRPDRVHRRLYGRLEPQRVAVRLAGDVDERRGPPVAGDDLEAGPRRRSPRVPRSADPHRRGRPACRTTTRADLLRRVGQPRDHDGVLAVVAVDAARGLRADRCPRSPAPPGPRRPGWPTSRAGSSCTAISRTRPPCTVTSPDVGQSRQPRPDGELGEVAEHQRIGAGQLVLQHRKHRRRQPLGAELELRRAATPGSRRAGPAPGSARTACRRWAGSRGSAPPSRARSGVRIRGARGCRSAPPRAAG